MSSVTKSTLNTSLPNDTNGPEWQVCLDNKMNWCIPIGSHKFQLSLALTFRMALI